MTAKKRRQEPDISKSSEEILTKSYEHLSPTTKLALQILTERVITNVIDFYHERYITTKNPLYVWRAYQLGRGYDLLPPWIAEYFDGCALRLLALSSSKDFEREITRAYGFKATGPKTYVARYLDDSKKADAVMHFAAVREKQPDKSVDEIYADVGEQFSVDERTIKRWVKELRRFLS